MRSETISNATCTIADSLYFSVRSKEHLLRANFRMSEYEAPTYISQKLNSQTKIAITN